MQVLPLGENPTEEKFQGILLLVDNTNLALQIAPEFFANNFSDSVEVEFTMANFIFKFQSIITLRNKQNAAIQIKKPEKIHRSKLRISQRLQVHQTIHYTLWTEGGRYEATITNLSSMGIRMMSDRFLSANTLISLKAYFPGESLSFICQGFVRWCKPLEEYTNKYDCGVQFTTLSTEGMKKIDRYIAEKLKKQDA